MQWLRDTGNDGLIIATVNKCAYSFLLSAKAETLGREISPGSDLFKVGTAQHISITCKSGVIER